MPAGNSSDKVLLTGASGFIAAHLLGQLLKKGYHVRGTVRSQKRADEILAAHPQYKDKLEFVIVEDIGKENAYAGTLEGISGIFHLASPFHFKVETSNKVDLLDPAINGTVQILKEAAKYPGIKRVVITSSFASILDSNKSTDYVYSEKDWNPITYEQALTVDPVTAYLASKKLAEKAAFDFVQEHKPHFDIATLCPPMVYGPFVHHVEKLTELNESARLFYDFTNGKKVETPGFDLYIDVRDLATSHVLAYEKPEASNQRFFVTAGSYDWQELLDYIHKAFPNKTKADVGVPGTHPAKRFLPDNSKSIKVLGLTYHTKEQTFHDTVTQLLQKQGQ